TEWAEIGVVLEDPYIIILRDLVEFPNGHRNGYVRMIPRPDLIGGIGVVMLPIYENGVVLLKHFRHSTRKWHFEIPRGYGEPNVSAENNARRELEEELGANISELISLGLYYPETGFESQCTEIFLTRINSIGSLATDEGIVSFLLLGFVELEDWIADGKITDGFTIAAYTKAKLKGLI
ncbi:MAG: NUDIX hydrolase, partial [Chloroflexota bacterium]